MGVAAPNVPPRKGHTGGLGGEGEAGRTKVV